MFKAGATSRADSTERIAEIKADLRSNNVVSVTPLAELPGYAFLESYFKYKYALQQTKLGQLTEYFGFDDKQIYAVLNGLRSLSSTPEEVELGRVR